MSYAISKGTFVPQRTQQIAVERTASRATFAPLQQHRARVSLNVRSTATADASSSNSVKKERKKGPLDAGGSLEGDKAFGKDAGAGALNKADLVAAKWTDPRWVEGTWDYAQFANKDGETDWNGVIDAEINRRRILEENPEACVLNEEVVFDTAEVPWTVWVKRFHLPEAELINGRAAMLGFFMAYMVDLTTGVSIVDACGSFVGKCAMGVTLLGCLVVRRLEDIESIQELSEEATFYDKQWAESWNGVERPSEKYKMGNNE